MPGEAVIQPCETGDLADVEALHAAAFPEEDLRGLVRALSTAVAGVLSLGAWRDGTLAGHVTLTPCGIDGVREDGVREGSPRRKGAQGNGLRQGFALLGPLAVAAPLRGHGIGGALVRESVARMADAGVATVLVLGDPAFYGRFGFAPERRIAPPCPIPEAWRDAWQSIRCRPGAPALAGTLCVPAPWRDPALWSA